MGIDWKKMKLTAEEKRIEREVERGLWRPVPREEFEAMAAALKRFRKNAVISIRINSMDLEAIKKKAKKLGVPYQTLIGEVLHRMAVE